MHNSKNKERGTKRERKTVIDRETDTEKVRQAGAKLGQAQLKLGLDFNLSSQLELH